MALFGTLEPPPFGRKSGNCSVLRFFFKKKIGTPMFGQLGQSRRPVISAVFGRSTVRRGNILEEGRCSCVTERYEPSTERRN